MDKLFVNGIIHSFDSGNRIYEAVGVTGEKIDGLGQEADLRKSAGHKTDLIDLKGSVMFPGLIDSHTHFLVFAYLQEGVNLADAGIKKMDDLLGRTMDQVMRLFTTGSAYLNREDHLAGTIEKGKRADFTVLAADPRLLPAKEAPDIPVRMTVVGGRIVYQQDL